ncbi:MAG TPA: ATP-binding protein, partial [Vicinamibacteria bacterium]|nr:ATP-binding protein [Vicinamibacteria bacterium]
LVEFVAPRFELEMVVAPEAVKHRLRQDVTLFKQGQLGALPMGYLLCGVIGTGKTFTATCFAGSLGIPAIVFKNLRSKWVGSSEGNLQKVLSVIKALGPVAVVVDEADAALGTRSSGGDSGTSSRMFAMISSLMSDTSYRGRILWMLLTCRPDLLPVDLKRQGRCEVHIPLFPPETQEARKEMFLAVARKSGVTIDEADVPPLPEGLTGADIEGLFVQSLRSAALESDQTPGAEHIRRALVHFRTPEYGLEKELQLLVAIRESTDAEFVPEPLRERYATPEKAVTLEHRIQEISALLRQ